MLLMTSNDMYPCKILPAAFKSLDLCLFLKTWVLEDGFRKFIFRNSFFEVRFCWFFDVHFLKVCLSKFVFRISFCEVLFSNSVFLTCFFEVCFSKFVFEVCFRSLLFEVLLSKLWSWVFTPRQKAEGVLLWAVLSLTPHRLLSFQFFSHYRSHFLMNHHDFWFVSCW